MWDSPWWEQNCAAFSFKSLSDIFAGGLNFHGLNCSGASVLKKAMRFIVKIAELTAKRS